MLHLVLALLFAGGGEPGGRARSQCPLVLSGWLSPADGLPEHRSVLTVRMRGREILWGGRAVSRRALHAFLSGSRDMRPAPFIIFDPAGAADCETATRIRDLIDRSAGCTGAVVCGQGPPRAWRQHPA